MTDPAPANSAPPLRADTVTPAALATAGPTEPAGPAPITHAPAAPAPPARRLLRVLIQLIGFAAGLALLGWCLSMAFKPENRAQLERLREASAWQVAGLLGLSLATLLINGLIFWISLLPARRLKPADVIATNAIATFLGYLPFKLGLVARVAIHNRRDRLPVLTIGAWLAAMAVTLFAALIPPALAGIWRKKLDTPWLIVTSAGVLAGFIAIVIAARFFAGERGLVRLDRFFGRLPLAGPALRSKAFRQLHAGFDMLANPACTSAAIGLRLLDLVVLSSRFAVASVILGAPIPWEQSFLVASTFFMIGVLSPFGVLGTREAGTTGIVALFMPGGDSAGHTFAVVALLVSATEAIAYLTAAAAGLAWLRPHRLFRPQPQNTAP